MLRKPEKFLENIFQKLMMRVIFVFFSFVIGCDINTLDAYILYF